MVTKKVVLAGIAMAVCAGVTRAQTVETNTFAEINLMASMWEGNPSQITSLVNTQYPAYNGDTWQYIFPVSHIESDGDIHIDMAVNSSGSGSAGNNAGESPVICEIVNATSAQLSHVTSISSAQALPVGIFRFWTEHYTAPVGERHFEFHPMTQLLTWNASSNAFLLDSDYHANITNDAYGVTTLNNDPAYEQELFNGDDDRMIATVMPDGNHLIFTWPSPNINYSQFAGIAMSGLTNDFVSNFFWFQPTSPMPSNVPVTVRCRIITNTYAARLASGLQSNQTVTVNALQRTDMLVVSNIIARMTAGQTTNVTAPVELVTLGLSSLGSVGPPVAIFSGSPTNGSAPLSVTFADTSTGSITNRFWSFGDGGTTNTTATSVPYVYQTTGNYQVSLIVSGLGGSNTNTKPNYIVVGSATPPPPVASFTNNPASGPAPLTVYFYDTSTGTPTNWSWTFGDGSGTSTSQNPNYTYNYPGSYVVTQIVANANGSSTNHGTITVSCPTITLSPNGANPTVLPGGTEGLAYNTQTITASGGAAPYTYAVTAGSLAGSGLTLSSAGTLSGASLVAGTYTFTVTATDTNNCPGSQAYSVAVLTQFASWEQFYDLSGTLTGGNASYTGDGMSNTNKFMAGFSPTNALAYLHVISIVESVAGSTNVVVTYLGANGDNSYVPGIASRTNVLDYTTGDVNGNYTNGGWQDTYQTNILSGGNGSGTITSMTDSNVTAGPDLYYRVRVLLP